MDKERPLEGKNVYLSGPMTGIEDHNRAGFAEAERAALAMGARSVFNPREAWGHTDRPRSWYMRHDLRRLTQDKGDGLDGPVWDVLLVLPGSEESAGALIERAVAEACGIEVAWLEGGGDAEEG
jgi:hypothetical protein